MLIYPLVHSSWSHRDKAIGAAKQLWWCFIYWRRSSSWRDLFLWSRWRCDWFATFHWAVFRNGRLCKENHRRRGVGKSLPRIFVHHAWKRVWEYDVKYNIRFLKQSPTMHLLSTNLVLIYCVCTQNWLMKSICTSDKYIFTDNIQEQRIESWEIREREIKRSHKYGPIIIPSVVLHWRLPSNKPSYLRHKLIPNGSECFLERRYK